MNTCTALINAQCMNMNSLMQIGLSSEDAKDYLIDHDVAIFECGPGYNSKIMMKKYIRLTNMTLNKRHIISINCKRLGAGIL
jgi:hypothetical protein